VWVFAVVALTLYAGFYAFFIGGYKCDESCFTPIGSEPHWTESRASWQWNGQFVLALAAIGMAGWGAYRYCRFGRRSDAWLVLGSLAVLGAWWLLVEPVLYGR
jgi:hypothetical protein